MKFRKLSAFILALLCLVSVHFTMRQAPDAPHGGEIKPAGRYYIEVLPGNDSLFIYLFDGKIKPVSNTGINGKIILYQYDNIVSTSELNSYKTDGFVAAVNNAAYRSCIVQFEIGGEDISARFEKSENIVKKIKSGKPQ